MVLQRRLTLAVVLIALLALVAGYGLLRTARPLVPLGALLLLTISSAGLIASLGRRMTRELGAMSRTMVDERERAVRLLAANEERMRLALSAANQGLFDIDVRTGAMTVSPEYCRMLGYDPDELTETVAKLRNRLHGDDRDRVVQAYQDFLAGCRSDFAVEFRQRTAHGGFRWVRSVGRIVERDSAGHPVRMVGIHTDITGPREAQEELRASRERLRQLGQAQEEAREAERARIARELHDELGQALTGLKLDLRWLAGRLPDGDEAGHTRVREAAALVDATVEAVRRVATELRPAILDDLGLASAIPWQAREFARRCGTEVTVTGADTIPGIEPARATAVFRILQEALTNVARHSQATAVAIEIRSDPDWLRLDIRDNGKGLEAPDGESRRPLGILGMQERARAWNGSVAVTPGPGGGTQVRILMPVRPGSPSGARATPAGSPG